MRTTTQVVLLATISVSLVACAPISATRSAPVSRGATILIMPPHDVTQRGVSHIAGEGSGRQLQRAVGRELSSISNYTIVLFEPIDAVNYSTLANKQDALAEGKVAGANYVLTLELGEFRDAAPLTFRTDFVTLKSGVLFAVNSGEEIWSLETPLKLERSNHRKYYGLIDDIAKQVAKSIAK